MKVKILEIRDKATMIPILCIDMHAENSTQEYYLRRCGYPIDESPNVLITHLGGGQKADNDPYGWGGRTYPVAHDWIIEHWNELEDGAVVCVETILGERETPKTSERFEERG